MRPLEVKVSSTNVGSHKEGSAKGSNKGSRDGGASEEEKKSESGEEKREAGGSSTKLPQEGDPADKDDLNDREAGLGDTKGTEAFNENASFGNTTEAPQGDE